jgi:hypothetical protein
MTHMEPMKEIDGRLMPNGEIDRTCAGCAKAEGVQSARIMRNYINSRDCPEKDRDFLLRIATEIQDNPKYVIAAGGAVRKHKAELWESDCGGYEDHKFTCLTCGHVHWVDGPDS